MQHYLADGLLLAGFMVSACVVTAAVEHPQSPFRTLLASVGAAGDTARRAVIGVGMGLTALGLIHSPWGKLSGAHMNPAVTLAFFRMGKVSLIDALGYIAAQFGGAVLGVAASAVAMGSWLSDPRVAFVITQPAPASLLLAASCEFTMSALLFGSVLWFSGSPRLAPWTAALCAALLALYITLEAPVSGMSINPARSFGSAVVAGRFDHYWLYVIAPTLGMLSAVEVRRWLVRQHTACPKLLHGQPCLFCTLHESRPAVALDAAVAHKG